MRPACSLPSMFSLRDAMQSWPTIYVQDLSPWRHEGDSQLSFPTYSLPRAIAAQVLAISQLLGRFCLQRHFASLLVHFIVIHYCSRWKNTVQDMKKEMRKSRNIRNVRKISKKKGKKRKTNCRRGKLSQKSSRKEKKENRKRKTWKKRKMHAEPAKHATRGASGVGHLQCGRLSRRFFCGWLSRRLWWKKNDIKILLLHSASAFTYLLHSASAFTYPSSRAP